MAAIGVAAFAAIGVAAIDAVDALITLDADIYGADLDVVVAANVRDVLQRETNRQFEPLGENIVLPGSRSNEHHRKQKPLR